MAGTKLRLLSGEFQCKAAGMTGQGRAGGLYLHGAMAHNNHGLAGR